jgi:hypothetical protein
MEEKKAIPKVIDLLYISLFDQLECILFLFYFYFTALKTRNKIISKSECQWICAHVVQSCTF